MYKSVPTALQATEHRWHHRANTLQLWSEEWIAMYTVAFKPKTLHEYKGLLRRNILPRFGHVELKQITSREVRRWTVELADSGVGPSRLRQSVSLLSSILDTALQCGLVETNPCASVRLAPRVKGTIRFLTAVEVERLAAAVPNSYAALIHVLGYGGLRWGEAIALRPRQCDLGAARLYIAETLTDVNGKLVPGVPKSRRARFVSLPGFLVDGLDAMIRLQARGPDDLIFTAPKGGPLRVGNFRNRVWCPALEAAGLPRGVRIHDLRHTCASLLIAGGANPMTIQRHLGHADIQTTFGVYGHMFLEQSGEAAAILQRVHVEPLPT